MRDMVVLINLDGAACRSTARKLRAEHIYCKILPPEATGADVRAQEALGILLSGGDRGEAAFIPHLEELLDSGLPVLGMGDAALTLCTHLGGSLGERADHAQVAQLHYDAEDPLFAQVEDGERYLPALRAMTPPEGATVIARAEAGALGIRDAGRPVYALAFQAEQNDPDGVQLLINFCKTICGCTLWWSNQTFMERARQEIERLAEGGEAVCALSGGVDSGVCAVLGNMALGHRLHCIFVDTGLLRKGEGDRVMAYYKGDVGLNLKRIDAGDMFLKALAGVRDPAEKEAIIFRLLKSILEKEVAALPGVRLILQGTNYSDTLSRKVQFPLAPANESVRMAEPVRELFKDEIRRVGEELGLPTMIIQRQPFPGSGLALRILGEVTEERLNILREADAAFREEIEQSGQSKRLWQYYATLAMDPLPGHEDRYIVTLRAVQAAEGSAATASRLPYDLLERVCQSIRQRTPQVRRILYDLTPSSNYSETDWR